MGAETAVKTVFAVAAGFKSHRAKKELKESQEAQAKAYARQQSIQQELDAMASAMDEARNAGYADLSRLDSAATTGWEGASTSLRPGIPVPVLYGLNRFGGNIINQYVYNNEQNEAILNMLLNMGEGEITSIDDIQINNNPIANFPSIDIDKRYGTNDQSMISEFGWLYDQKEIGLKIEYQSEYNYTTTKEVDAFRLNFLCPNGLYASSSKDGDLTHTVNIQVQYKIEGGSWQTRNFSRTAKQNSAFRFSETFSGLSFGVYDIKVKFENADINKSWAEDLGQWYPLSFDAWWASTYDSQLKAEIKNTWVTYVNQGTQVPYAGYEPLDPNTFYPTSENYQFVEFAKTYMPNGFGYQDENLITYVIKYYDVLYLSAVQEIIEEGLTYPNTSLLSLKAISTNQLNSSTPKVTALVKGIKVLCPDIYYNGALVDYDDYYYDPDTEEFKLFSDDSVCSWDGTSYSKKYSANPAWCFYDLMTNKRYGMGNYIETDNLDIDSFLEVAKFSDEKASDLNGGYYKRYRMDIAIDSQTRAIDLLSDLATCVRGYFVFMNGVIKLRNDKPRESSQIINMGNIIEGSFSQNWKSIQEQKNRVEVTYIDKEKNYIRDMVAIDDFESIAEETKIRKSSVRVYTNDRSRAVKEGRYVLYMSRYINRVASFKTFIDCITVEPGQVVTISYDVPQWGFSGRLSSGENIPAISALANLIAHFNGEQGATEYTEKSKYANAMVFNSGALLTQVTKSLGSASLRLNTTSASAYFPASNGFPLSGGVFRMKVRFDATTSSGYYYIASQIVDDDNKILLYLHKGYSGYPSFNAYEYLKLEIWVAGSRVCYCYPDIDTLIVDESFQEIAISFDDSYVNLYFEGARKWRYSLSAPLENLDAPLYLGKPNDASLTSLFQGNIDEAVSIVTDDIPTEATEETQTEEYPDYVPEQIGDSTIDRIVLDKEVSLEEGKTYFVEVQFNSDDLKELREVTNAPGTYDYLDVAISFSKRPEKWDKYIFGEMGKVGKPFIVTDISIMENEEVEVNCIEYNETVYNEDDLVLPTDNYSALNPNIPNVTDLAVSERLIKTGSGKVENVIDIQFQKPEQLTYFLKKYNRAAIYLRSITEENSPWLFQGETSGEQFSVTSGIVDLTRYEIAVVSLSSINESNPISISPTAEIYILGKSKPPENIQMFTVNQDGNNLVFSWNAVSDIDLSHYEIREGASWDSGTVVRTNIIGNSLTIPVFAFGDRRYMIKAVDTSRIYSNIEAVTTFDITAAPDIVFLQEDDLDVWEEGVNILSDYQEVVTNSAGEALTDSEGNILSVFVPSFNVKTDVFSDNVTDRFGEILTTSQNEPLTVETYSEPYLELYFDETAGANGQGAYIPQGFYMTKRVDLGAKVKVNIVVNENFTGNSASSKMFIFLSDDGQNFGSMIPFASGSEYECRYFRIYYVLRTAFPGSPAQLWNLKSFCTIREIDDSGELDNAPASGSILFNKTFYVKVKPFPLAEGTNTVYWTLKEDLSGFDYNIVDENGDPATGKIVWLAKGY